MHDFERIGIGNKKKDTSWKTHATNKLFHSEEHPVLGATFDRRRVGSYEKRRKCSTTHLMHVNFLPDRIQNIWVAFFHLVFLGGCLQVILRQASEALLMSFLNLHSLKVLNIDQLTT